MLVKEFAQKADVPSHIVRYYSRIGLLRPARNPQNGYQQFGYADLARIRFIRKAQLAGLNLSLVEALLEMDDWRTRDCCTRGLQMLRNRLEEKRCELIELQALVKRMQALLAEWGEPAGCVDGQGCVCPRIEESKVLTCE